MKIQLLLCLICFCIASAIGQTPLVVGSYVSTSGQADSQRNNSIFSYTGAGTPWNGTLLTVGGFNSGSYPLQLNADYGPNGGNHLSFRTRTDDAGAHWNSWYEIYHSGNLSKPDVDFTCKNLSVNGMVGIGTSAYWQLSVKDIIALTGNNNQILHIRPNSGYGGYIYWAESGVSERGVLGFNAGSGDLVYRSGASDFSNGAERFRIAVNGNIGIGTPSPQNLLDVNGTIHAREVKVDLIGWADFVFAPTYKLRPLAEVEQFIKTNGHLPEIPKAEEVQQNGVNLGEMQTMLLQKVEELTLYSIELKNENIEQSKENAELKQKLADYEKEMKELKKLIMGNHK